MKNLLIKSIFALSLLGIFFSNTYVYSQNRDIKSERIILDDNNGNIITIQTPAGPITGGTLTLPDPAGNGTILISNPSGGSQSMNGDLVPGADDTYDLGSGASRWQDIFMSGVGSFGNQVRFVETGGGTNYVGFKAPAAIASNKVWTLPAADGSIGQALTTDGSGNLSWASAGGGGGGATATTDTPNNFTLAGGAYQDSGIEFTLDANSVYQMYGYLELTETATGTIDTKITYDGSLTSAFFDGDFGYDTSNLEDLNSSITLIPYRFIGTIVSNAGGTLKLQIRNNAGSTGTNVLTGTGLVTLIKM